MANKQKLELTWYGKDNEIKIEPRILIEDEKNQIVFTTPIPKACSSMEIIFLP